MGGMGGMPGMRGGMSQGSQAVRPCCTWMCVSTMIPKLERPAVFDLPCSLEAANLKPQTCCLFTFCHSLQSGADGHKKH